MCAELLPFKVYTDDDDDGGGLVWAADADAAITLARAGHLFGELEDERELFASEQEAIEGYGPPLSPGIESRDRWLRGYGWSCEGDDRCWSCGLATMDGKFRLCADCLMCEDCGHEHDCPRHQLLGRQAERFGEVAGRLIYITGPYGGGAVEQNLARIGLLCRLLIRLHAHPVALHAALHAGHYDDDRLTGRRPRGRVTSAIARQIRAGGGGVIALEREGGGLSDGTRQEVVAANNGTAWGLIGRGREPQPGVAVLRWCDLGDVFEAQGLGEEWARLGAAVAAEETATADDERLMDRVAELADALNLAEGDSPGLTYDHHTGSWDPPSADDDDDSCEADPGLLCDGEG